jgi:hypothetical protein
VPFEVSGRRTADAIEGTGLVVSEGGPHGIDATRAAEVDRALLDVLSR